MSPGAPSRGPRANIYGALTRRNRIISLLRILVPILGAAVLGVLGVQMVLNTMAKDFSIGSVSLQRDRLVVDAPSYAGRLSDGGVYRVLASKAEAAIGAANIIHLFGAGVSLERPDGVVATAQAEHARLDSEKETVTVEGVTSIGDSTGTNGTLGGMHIDFGAQVVTAAGPVSLAFGSGEQIEAEAMSFDAARQIWRFERVTVTLPDTPGAAGS